MSHNCISAVCVTRSASKTNRRGITDASAHSDTSQTEKEQGVERISSDERRLRLKTSTTHTLRTSLISTCDAYTCRSSDREAPESSGFELDFKNLFDHWEFEVDPVTHVAVEHGWWWSLFDLDSFDPDEHHGEGSDDWRAVFAPHVDLRVTHPLSCKPNTGYTQPLRGDPDSGCQFDESDSDGLSELL